MLLSRFASPFEGNFIGLAENLTCRNLRKVLARANACAAAIGVDPIAIREEDISPERLSLRSWTPELGAVQLGISRGVSPEAWSWVSGQFLLAAFVSGAVQSVDLEIAATHPLTLAGRFFAGDRFRVRGDQLELVVSDAHGCTLARFAPAGPPGFGARWVESPDQLVRLGSAGLAILGTDRWMDYWHAAGEKGSPPCRPEADKRCLEETLRLMEELLPEYYLWTTALLSELVLIEALPDGTQNQSFGMYPGHVQGPAPTPVRAIVTLVHECSHQYFNLLLWHGRPAAPGAPSVYSVLKRVDRPLDRILIGFHAVGNILLALRALRDRGAPGVDPAELAAQIQEHERLLQSLDQPLRMHAERHLTEMGKQIYLPLRSRMVGVDLLAAA